MVGWGFGLVNAIDLSKVGKGRSVNRTYGRWLVDGRDRGVGD